MRTTVFRMSSVAVLLIGILVACDNSPNRPSSTPTTNPGGNQPPPQTAPSLVRIELSGPDVIAPGATGKFTLNAVYSDGSTVDRSAQGSWYSSNTGILSISAGGNVAGKQRGEVSIGASFSGRSATKSGVLVLPEGTFRLRGAVRDAGIGVNGARVEISEGPFTGMWTDTKDDGSYAFYGVAGDVELSVTRNGYQFAEQRLRVTGHQTFDIDLLLSGSRDAVQGRYVLRVSSGGECAGKIPSDLRARTYTADITQTGRRITVTLSGATFHRSSSSAAPLNKFSGNIEPGVLDVQLKGYPDAYYYYYYYGYFPEVAELINPTTMLGISGRARLTRTGSGYAGMLSGNFAVLNPTGVFNRPIMCFSPGHHLELVGPEK